MLELFLNRMYEILDRDYKLQEDKLDTCPLEQVKAVRAVKNYIDGLYPQMEEIENLINGKVDVLDD